MSESLTCDTCGSTAVTEGLIGWYRVEQASILILAFGVNPGPWHFCSTTCLASFATNKP